MIIEQIIEQCQKNNIKAQEQLYRLLSAKLFGVCLKYSPSYDEAQDNLQEIFLIIFDKIHQLKNTSSLEGWAKKIAVNYVLQQYRNKGVFELLSDKIADEENIEIEDNDISIEKLTEFIQQLPDRYRLVFTMYVIDGYSHKEIAEMLQINIGTSKSNLSRAKTILQEKISLQQNYAAKAK